MRRPKCPVPKAFWRIATLLFTLATTPLCATAEWHKVATTVHAEVRQAHTLRSRFLQDKTATNLLFEAELCYQRALIFAEFLRVMPVEEFTNLLTHATAPDRYRPTLYDITLYDLIDLYLLMINANVGYQKGALAPDGPLFDDTEKFMEDLPEQLLSSFPALRGLRLFQALLTFHKDDPEPSAYADADLQRLRFSRQLMPDQSADAPYSLALDRFWNKWRKHEIMAHALALRAQMLLDEKPAFARMLAQNGANTFPDTPGAATCRNLIAAIEQPTLATCAPTLWHKPWPQLHFTYKNLERLTLFATAATTTNYWELLQKSPVKSWNIPLPRAAEYRQRDFESTVPRDLPPGHYAIFVTANAELQTNALPILVTLTQVTAATSTPPPPPTPFTRLCGAWPTVHEPDTFSYRTWRK